MAYKVVKTESPTVREPPQDRSMTGVPQPKVVAEPGGDIAASPPQPKVVAEPGGETGASPPQDKWIIHAVNVHQGDAILLDILCSADGEPQKRHKCLIDGGTGYEKPLENLLACLESQGCVSRSASGKKELQVEVIISTHPDKDHTGGLTRLLGRYSYHGQLVITEAFTKKLLQKEAKAKNDKAKKDEGKKAVPKPFFLREFFDAVGQTFGKDVPSIFNGKFERCGSLRCHFPMSEFSGIIYPPEIAPPPKLETASGKCKSEEGKTTTVAAQREEASADKMTSTTAARPKRMTEKFANSSSILTTINESANGFDVLLTGDSSAELIQPVISEKTVNPAKPHIQVFQVPHHGSKNNSSYEFYASFTADIYLVSGGGNNKYNHPHMTVISDIIQACVCNSHKSYIVVTNSLGLKLPFTNEAKTEREILAKGLSGPSSKPKWRDFVTIYHLDDLFNPRSSVTIKPDLKPEESDVVCWSPRGYVSKITECQMKLQAKEVQIFKKDTKSRLVSCSDQLQFDEESENIRFDTKSKNIVKFTILLAPVPEEPWGKKPEKGPRIMNRIFMLKESISGDYKSAWFLELDEQTKTQVPKAYHIYRYTDDYFECKEYHSEKRSGRAPRMRCTLKPEQP